jgi:PKD repeat protein
MRKSAVAAALACAVGLAAVRARADHVPPGAVDPSAEEQAGIYEINRARNDPPAYGLAIGVDLAGVPARPPLAVNRLLTGSARFHADVMLDHHEYGHVSTLLGIGGNQMAVNNGYDLFGNGLGYAWGTANSIESIMRSVNQVATATNAVKAFVIDKDVAGAGHRVHLLAIGSFGNHREIGFGWAAGSDAFPEYGLPKTLPTKLCAIHTAYSAEPGPFLTGVVFRDANRNRRFDRGEGIGGATVEVEGVGTILSQAAGGWSLAAPAGTRLVRCSGGTFAGSAAVLATVGADNVEVDFHSGSISGELDFSWRDAIPAGPSVQVTADPAAGPAPLGVAFGASGVPGGVYTWDLANGNVDTGASSGATYTEAGLYPVVVTGTDGSGSARALALVSVSDPAFPGEGLTAPADGALHLGKGILKRATKTTGKDSATLAGTLELPGGFAPAGTEISVCVAGALRTFTLDAAGKGSLPDGSKVSLKTKWPKGGLGVAAGTVAKLKATLKGNLAIPLEAAGLRDRTETRVVAGVPAAVLFAGKAWVASGTLATKSVQGKSGKGTLLPQ